jgi:hypothetical protein
VNCEKLTAEFCHVAGTLGDQLAALLFQLPPSLKKDLARLDAFIDTLPPKAPAAFEFRHPSWFDQEVFGRLRERGRALCVADSEKLETPLEVTADFGYFRFAMKATRRMTSKSGHAGLVPLAIAAGKSSCTSSTKNRDLAGVRPTVDETPGIRVWGLGIGSVASRKSQVESRKSQGDPAGPERSSG